MTLKNGYSESHGCSGGGALLVTSNDTKDLSWEMETNLAVVENLIIENSYSHNGGGLSIYRVDGPTVSNLIVRNNSATMHGGGIFVYSSDVAMEDVEITAKIFQRYMKFSSLQMRPRLKIKGDEDA